MQLKNGKFAEDIQCILPPGKRNTGGIFVSNI